MLDSNFPVAKRRFGVSYQKHLPCGGVGYSTILGMDYYFFEGGGEGQFPLKKKKTFPHLSVVHGFY